MRIYDGRTCEWVELLLVPELRQRWMSFDMGGYRMLFDEPGPGREIVFCVGWRVGGHAVGATLHRPTRAQAEQSLRPPTPDGMSCPACDAQWLFFLRDAAGAVCAACGTTQSYKRIIEGRYTFPIRQRAAAPRPRTLGVGDAIEVMGINSEWSAARVVGVDSPMFSAVRDGEEARRAFVFAEQGHRWRWPVGEAVT